MTTAASLRQSLPAWAPMRLAAGALVGFVALSALSTEDGPVLCPFRRCSGGYCPGCGMTRSAGRLLQGDVAGSWAHHPYVVLALAQVAVAAAAWRLGSASLRGTMEKLVTPALAVNLALVSGIWLSRLVDGSIPAPFAGS